MSLASGTRLGPYEVLGLIGAGGTGEVYKARDTRLDRTVTVKILPAELCADPDPSAGSGSSRAKSRDERRARLLREARLASQLDHPRICPVHDVGEADNRVCIAMELAEGQPLRARLDGGAFPAGRLPRFGSQIADALAHLEEEELKEA
jgi:serine/threonine protein kinase